MLIGKTISDCKLDEEEGTIKWISFTDGSTLLLDTPDPDDDNWLSKADVLYEILEPKETN